MTLDQVNSLRLQEFVELLGGVFEHSPWISERAWPRRPFASLDNLWREMTAVVDAAPEDEKLALLRAHPDLGTRAKVGRRSADEQAEAGLNALNEGEYQTLLDWNNKYRGKFGFPFIYAVKGSGKFDIHAALMLRMMSTPEEEIGQALWEVGRIARFRLEDILKE